MVVAKPSKLSRILTRLRSTRPVGENDTQLSTLANQTCPTGTITLGQFQVTDHRFLQNISAAPLWQVVALVEQASSHPIARAVQTFAQQKVPQESNVEIRDCRELPGKGMQAIAILDRDRQIEVAIGNEKILQEVDATLKVDNKKTLKLWQSQGKSIVIVSARTMSNSALDGLSEKFIPVAMLAVNDPPRPEAAYVLDNLRAQKIDVYIVSGDAVDTVRAVARTLNIPEDHAIGGTLPEDKRTFVAKLQETSSEVDGGRKLFWRKSKTQFRRKVAFVGDGVNDSIGKLKAWFLTGHR